MAKYFSILGLLLLTPHLSAGMPAPLQGSLNVINTVMMELPNNTHFSKKIINVEVSENVVAVTFNDACVQLYSVEYSMDPIGTITDIQAHLYDTNCQ